MQSTLNGVTVLGKGKKRKEMVTEEYVNGIFEKG